MKALLLERDELRFRNNYPEAEPPEGEVLVRVRCAGICETDLQLAQGYMHFQGVLGHEFVGVAESGRLKGQRVVGEINCACQTCDLCRRGDASHCPNRSVLGILRRDGAFAEYLSLPEANLHVVPESIPDEDAVFTEPLAAAFEIPTQIQIGRQQSVCVLGDGRLGNLCAQVLMTLGADVTVVGKHREKLQRPELAGAQVVLLDELDVEKAFEVVVDCTGSSHGLETAIRLTRPRGTLVMKTTVAAPHRLSLAPIVIDEITIVGSRCGPFDQALLALDQHHVDVSQLLSARYPLEEFERAFAHAQQPDAMKVIFEIS